MRERQWIDTRFAKDNHKAQRVVFSLDRTNSFFLATHHGFNSHFRTFRVVCHLRTIGRERGRMLYAEMVVAVVGDTETSLGFSGDDVGKVQRLFFFGGKI